MNKQTHAGTSTRSASLLSGRLLLAAAVLAFAVPAAAHASTGLTEGGTLGPVGKIFTLTNVGQFVPTSNKTGNITCASEKVMIEANLTANTLTRVVAEEGGASYTASCTTSTGGVATFKNFRINKIETTGGGTGTVSLFFEFELSPGGMTCKYTGTNDVFTYNPSETTEGGSVIAVSKQKLSVTPAPCGTTAELDVAFKLATAGTTTPVYLM